MATSPHRGNFLLELIGPSENLSQVTIMFDLPDHDRDARNINLINVIGFLGMVFPEWEEAPDWVGASIGSTSGSGERSTLQDGELLSIHDSRDLLGLVTMTVEPE